MTDETVPPTEPTEPVATARPAAPPRPAARFARAAAPAAPARPARPAVPVETPAEEAAPAVEAPLEDTSEGQVEETRAETPVEEAPVAAEDPAAAVVPEPAPAPAAATPPPPPGAPYGGVAIEQAKPSRWKGLARRLAIPAVIVAGLVTWGQLHDADRDDKTGEISDKGSMSSLEVRKGDCLQLPDAARSEEGGEVKSITAIPCKQPHDAEAIAATKMRNPAFPGDAKVEAFSNRFCSRQYRAFVGKPFRDENPIQLSYLYPTKASWAQGDRGVTCVVYQDGKQTTGSLKGGRV